MEAVIPEVISQGPHSLGEGVLWDHRISCLYWVDIEGKAFLRKTPDGEERRYELPGMPGTAVLTENPSVIVLAVDTGFVRLDTESGRLTPAGRPPEGYDAAVERFNDGKCDPIGRLWIGTMRRDAAPGTGILYRARPDLSLEPVHLGATVSNGLAWDEARGMMYYTDSPTRQILGFDYDAATGNISDPRPVVRIPEGWGYPDGMTIDVEGRLWVAHWAGECVACYDPATGQAMEKIGVPSLYVTCCTFGGDELSDLYVTTALGSQDGGWADRERYPLSGSVFRIPTAASGRPSWLLAG